MKVRVDHEIPEKGFRHASDHMSMGTGVRTGRRPKQYAVDKGDLYDIIRQLHSRGMGQNVIGYLLGYSPPIISRMLRDMSLPKHNPGTIVAAIIEHLPDSLKVEARKIRMKSELAHQRAAIKAGLVEHKPTVHRLEDD